MALAAALPELPYACGLATMSLLAGDVTAEPLAESGGELPVRRPAVDLAELARWETDPGPWRRRAAAAAGYLTRHSRVNPSTAFGTVFADELARCGLREVVVAPGSRSTPMAMALHDLAAAGRVRLHVRIDERSASFTALGLAKASRRPVAVLCTSGTAAANFHPAVIEADESGVPLLVLTADRPPELRGTGASQTIDQVKLYGAAVRWYAEAGVPQAQSGAAGYWRSLACQAWAHAAGTAGTFPGPVHVNLPFRDPLVPGEAAAWPETLDGRADGGPWTRIGGGRRRRSRWSSRGPNAAWWCAGTETTTPPRCSSSPSGRAGRCSPSRRRARAAARTPWPDTSTCWHRASSWRRTSRR